MIKRHLYNRNRHRWPQFAHPPAAANREGLQSGASEKMAKTGTEQAKGAKHET